MNDIIIYGNDMLFIVYDQVFGNISVLTYNGCTTHGRAAQSGADSCHQLGSAERLRDIVVGAR